MFVSGPVGTSVIGLVRGADRVGDEVDRVPSSRARVVGGGSDGPSIPLSPWTYSATNGSRRAAGRSAGGDRDVGAAGELEQLQRVDRRLLERLVPVDGRDADELDLRAREREQERDRVVVARGRSRAGSSSRRSISSTSAAVGSDGCAPGREAAIAPAAQARRERLLARRGPRAARRGGRR